MKRLSVWWFGMMVVVMGCNISDESVHVNDQRECESDDQCTDGSCQDGECVADVLWDFLDTCQQDSECHSGLCVEGPEGGQVCSSRCDTHEECDADTGWLCQPYPGRIGDYCLPAPPAPPASRAATLCGAAGV
jgi:hypothetical protein